MESWVSTRKPIKITTRGALIYVMPPRGDTRTRAHAQVFADLLYDDGLTERWRSNGTSTHAAIESSQQLIDLGQETLETNGSDIVEEIAMDHGEVAETFADAPIEMVVAWNASPPHWLD